MQTPGPPNRICHPPPFRINRANQNVSWLGKIQRLVGSSIPQDFDDATLHIYSYYTWTIISYTGTCLSRALQCLECPSCCDALAVYTKTPFMPIWPEISLHGVTITETRHFRSHF